MKKYFKSLCVVLCFLITFSFSTFASSNSIPLAKNTEQVLQSYKGKNFSGEINGKIKENNNQVQIFENNKIQYTYEYDSSGFRTKKRIFKLPLSEKLKPIWEIEYIWENNKIIGYVFTN